MTRHIEALSQAIDELNAGRIPETVDNETADLVEVAALLKKAELPVRPPLHVLEATTGRAAAGLAVHKKSRSNSWLYSGVAGAAAAALLFLGIHGLPAWEMESKPVSETQVVTTPSSPSAANPAPIPKTGSSEPSQPSATLKSVPTSPPPTASSPSATPRPDTTQKSSPVNEPPVAENYGVARKSVPLPSPSPSKTGPTALSIPNKKPDAVTTDAKAGVIRQIYDSGTNHEIIITQRPLPKEKDAAASQSKSIAWKEADIAKPDTINKVTLTIQNQEVTIEGRKTKEELLELAKTLK